ncbi:MAG TPA: metal-dependent hydrolase [Terracidiphilus sp.]|nr:metal-dependent hydrolase [Terracidiphilus sp.]
MEPLTHFLTGACLGRAGLNRKTAYATLAAVLAAEAADIDIFWWFAGPVEELKRHRGITHTLIGAPFVAGAVVGGIWLWHFWRERRRGRLANAADENGKGPPGSAPPSAPGRQAIRWGWLYLTALIAALSHLVLDWTNNYGVRPFFPFNPRWYAGSIVFIAEPVLWALFFLALVLPWLFGLTDAEIGARRKPFRGRGWAIFALSGMVLLWCWRWAEQADARATLENMQVTSAPVMRVTFEPYPVDPWRWHAILETADYYQTAEINTRTGEVESDSRRDTIYKPPDTPAVEAAKHTALGQAYLDWGTWAMVRDLGPEPLPGVPPPQLPPGRTWTTVEFSDLRFAYSFLSTRGGAGRTPLGGWVYVVGGREEAGQGMGGRAQK